MQKADAYQLFRTECVEHLGFVDPEQAFLAGVTWAELNGNRMFNLNDVVKVKLTPIGKTKLLADHAIFNARLPERIQHPYRPPAEDKDGWSTWQMWYLMSCLGHHLSLGCEMPFDPVILIKSKYGE